MCRRFRQRLAGRPARQTSRTHGGSRAPVSRWEPGPEDFRTGRSFQDGDDLRLEPTGDVDDPRGVDEDVDLAPDSELGEVDSGLDREAGPGEDQAFVVGF